MRRSGLRSQGGTGMAETPDKMNVFASTIDEHLAVIEALRNQQPVLARIAAEMVKALLRGNKVLWCGNGGSAADSQHLAAELIGRFRRERRAMPSIAFTTDTSILTALGNDYGFEQVFRRQVEALCVEGDVLVGLSTSGNSRNVCLALEEARARGAVTVAFTGAGGGAMKQMAGLVLCAPSNDTARIQEAHILCGHMLCDWVELELCACAADKEAVSR
jgi:D-sedoheptulose 7-phosphate isomerase